jgi:hypothetical protein
LKAGFIYPIPLTDWVSNIVPVNKKQGTIRICIDYRDINRACPKDNYPTPYIDQIIDDCAGSEMFSFMDGFSAIIKSIFYLPINQKRHSFVHGGHLLIANYLLGLRMPEQLFNGLCLMHFMTSSTLCNPISMICLLILYIELITLSIYEQSL